LKLLGIIEGFPTRAEALAYEDGLHALFAPHRMEGEWFEPAPAVLEHVWAYLKSVPESVEAKGGDPRASRPEWFRVSLGGGRFGMVPLHALEMYGGIVGELRQMSDAGEAP